MKPTTGETKEGARVSTKRVHPRIVVALLAVFAYLGLGRDPEPELPIVREHRLLKATIMGSVLGPAVVLVPYWFLFIIGGSVIAVIGYAVTRGTDADTRGAIIAYAISGILIVLGVSVGVGAGIDMWNGGEDPQKPFCERFPNDPSCVWAPDFTILVPSTPAGAGRDTAAEIPGAPFTQCGSMSPAATMITYNTDAYVDSSNKRIEMQVAINDDLAPTTAGYQLDECFLVDFAINLENGRDADGDSNIDAVTYFGRIRSITRTTMVDGNSSQPYNVFYWDTTNGWYMGWMKESASQASNGDWISSYPAGVSDDRLPTGASEWKQLGSHSGGSAEYVSFWFAARNYGIFGYTQPPVGSSVDILVDIGTVEIHDTWTVQVKLNARD
jgi:hypothetical protein